MNVQRPPDRDSRLAWILVALIGLIVVSGSVGSLAILRPWHLGPRHDWPIPFFPFVSLGLMTVLHLALAVWIGLDARKRGMNGILWGALVFVASIVGVIVYLIVASSPPARAWSASFGAQGAGSAACRGCGSPLRSEYKACPHCGTTVRACAACGRALDRDWRHCPFCGAGATG